MGGTPVNKRAGNAMKLPPPATAFKTPPRTPATNSRMACPKFNNKGVSHRPNFQLRTETISNPFQLPHGSVVSYVACVQRGLRLQKQHMSFLFGHWHVFNPAWDDKKFSRIDPDV